MKNFQQFVKTLDLKTRPYFASAALINFAQMAHRQCISEYHKNFTIPTPVLGDHMCTKRQVLEELLPFLKEKLEVRIQINYFYKLNYIQKNDIIF